MKTQEMKDQQDTWKNPRTIHRENPNQTNLNQYLEKKNPLKTFNRKNNKKGS